MIVDIFFLPVACLPRWSRVARRYDVVDVLSRRFGMYTCACNISTWSDRDTPRNCRSKQHRATYTENNCCLNSLQLKMTPLPYVYFEAHPSSTTSASPGCTDPCLAAWPSGVTRNTLQPSLRRGRRRRRCSSPCLRALSSSTIASSSSPSDPGSKATKVQATGSGQCRV